MLNIMQPSSIPFYDELKCIKSDRKKLTLVSLKTNKIYYMFFSNSKISRILRLNCTIKGNFIFRKYGVLISIDLSNYKDFIVCKQINTDSEKDQKTQKQIISSIKMSFEDILKFIQIKQGMTYWKSDSSNKIYIICKTNSTELLRNGTISDEGRISGIFIHLRKGKNNTIKKLNNRCKIQKNIVIDDNIDRKHSIEPTILYEKRILYNVPFTKEGNLLTDTQLDTIWKQVYIFSDTLKLLGITNGRLFNTLWINKDEKIFTMLVNETSTLFKYGICQKDGIIDGTFTFIKYRNKYGIEVLSYIKNKKITILKNVEYCQFKKHIVK